MTQYISTYASSRTAKAVLSGAGGQPKQYTKGGEYAYGEIVFADNPTAADTVTLNGIYVEFTASASDETAAGTAVDPVLVNIKASLALTLDELVIVTNAAAHSELAVATYSEDGVDTFEVTYDTVGTGGNAYTLAASADTPSGAVLTGGTATPAISLKHKNIDLALTDTRDQLFSLADGVEFQEKTIAMTAKGTGNGVVTPANFSSGTTITFDTDGDTWYGIFINGNWKTVASDATVA